MCDADRYQLITRYALLLVALSLLGCDQREKAQRLRQQFTSAINQGDTAANVAKQSIYDGKGVRPTVRLRDLDSAIVSFRTARSAFSTAASHRASMPAETSPDAVTIQTKIAEFDGVLTNLETVKRFLEGHLNSDHALETPPSRLSCADKLSCDLADTILTNEQNTLRQIHASLDPTAALGKAVRPLYEKSGRVGKILSDVQSAVGPLDEAIEKLEDQKVTQEASCWDLVTELYPPAKPFGVAVTAVNREIRHGVELANGLRQAIQLMSDDAATFRGRPTVSQLLAVRSAAQNLDTRCKEIASSVAALRAKLEGPCQGTDALIRTCRQIKNPTGRALAVRLLVPALERFERILASWNEGLKNWEADLDSCRKALPLEH